MSFGTKNREIVRNLSVVSFFTLISRILGLLRDICIAYFFGAGEATDAFFVAFRIPNLFRRLFGEGGITASFIPVYSGSLVDKDEEGAADLLKTVFTVLFFILLILSAIGFLFSFLFVAVTAPGFLHKPLELRLAVILTRAMFPYILFIGLSAFFAGILNVHKAYAPGAIYPIILNIMFIVAAVFIRPFFHPQIYALAAGVMLGGFFQLLSQLYYIRKKKIKLGFKLDLKNPGVRSVFRLLTPSLFGMAVIQLNLLFDTLLASFLPSGSISYLYYGDRLYQFPLGVFAIAMQTAIFPVLSASFAKKDVGEVGEAFNFASMLMFFIIIPASIGLIILRGDLSTLIYRHGIFNASDAEKTAGVLMYFTLGLWASAMLKTVVPVFYSMKDTATPVKAAVISLFINIIAAVILMKPMGVFGLALASSLSLIFNYLYLLNKLRRSAGIFLRPRFFASLAKTIAAGLGMAVPVQLAAMSCHKYHYGLTVSVITSVAAGGLAFFIISFFLRNEPLNSIKEFVIRKN